MNIFCHVPRENWICDRIGQEYSDNSIHNIISDKLTDSTEAVWLLAAWCWNQIHYDFLSSRKVVCTIHHEVPEKFDDNRFRNFMSRDKIVDAYHVPCKQTYDFISKITDKPIYILSYWVNPKLWKPKNRLEMKRKHKLPEDSLVIGSFQRDTEGHDLVSPKLEKGPDRFCDYVEKLKNKGENVHVLLNGWRRQYVINRLIKLDIPFTYVELPPIEIVSEMYSACDLYIVGSRYEGGPQSILECAISKTPIVSTSVGIANNILPERCIIDMSNDYSPYMPTESDVEYCFNKSQNFLLHDHAKKYDELFTKIIMT